MCCKDKGVWRQPGSGAEPLGCAAARAGHRMWFELQEMLRPKAADVGEGVAMEMPEELENSSSWEVGWQHLHCAGAPQETCW